MYTYLDVGIIITSIYRLRVRKRRVVRRRVDTRIIARNIRYYVSRIRVIIINHYTRITRITKYEYMRIIRTYVYVYVYAREREMKFLNHLPRAPCAMRLAPHAPHPTLPTPSVRPSMRNSNDATRSRIDVCRWLSPATTASRIGAKT